MQVLDNITIHDQTLHCRSSVPKEIGICKTCPAFRIIYQTENKQEMTK